MAINEKEVIIESIDNRIRELNMLDLVKIGFYNVHLAVFGHDCVGRLAIISDNDPILEVEAFDTCGNSLGRIKTPRKNVIRSIIDYEFKPEELSIYDGYITYEMLQSLNSFDSSVAKISAAFAEKRKAKKEIFDIERRIKESTAVIDFEYCEIGSKTLYNAVVRLIEELRREYIREGIESSSYNSSIEKLERGLLGKRIHRRRIDHLRKDKKANKKTRLSNAAAKNEELLDCIEKYMQDFEQRCMTVLKNYGIFRIAKKSYEEATKADEIEGDKPEVTAKMIYDHFAQSLPTEEIMDAHELFERFKKYILGCLYNSRDLLDQSLVELDATIKEEFGKQEEIASDFIPLRGIKTSDEQAYKRVYRERRK